MRKKAKVKNLNEYRNKKEVEKEIKKRKQREFEEAYKKESKAARKRLFKKRLLKKLKMVAYICILFLFGFFLYRWSFISTLAYQRNSLEKELEKMQSKTKEINLELEKMTNSNYVEKLAREKLNMDYPKDEQLIYMQIQ